MNRLQKLLTVVIATCLLLLAAHLSGLDQHFSLARVQQLFAGNMLVGLLVFTLLFMLGNLIHLPGWPLLVAAVLALGEVCGGITTYCAAVISCSSTFWMVRLVGGDALREIRFGWARRLLGQLDAQPVRSIAILRFFLLTMPTLNVVLAMSGIRFRSYLAGTLLGLPLPIALLCVFFDYLARALGVPGY